MIINRSRVRAIRRLADQSVEMNAYSKTECRWHDSYLSVSFQMDRTYGSHDYFIFLFNGLKSVVTILAEATPLSVNNDFDLLSFCLLFI